jgi:putative oxidoreductase
MNAWPMRRHEVHAFVGEYLESYFYRRGNAMVKSIISAASSIYRLFGRSANKLQSPFLLAIRLYWGWQLAQSGWGKLHHLPQVTDFFASLNIPFSHANAIFVSNLELFGGVLLILGLASRATGFMLTVNMLVAYVTADREALGSVFSDPGKFYAADPYTFLFASLIVLIFGAGYLSVDAIIARVVAERTPKIRTPWPTSTSADATARV